MANGDKVVNGFDQNIKINDGDKGKTDVFTPERLNDLGSKSSRSAISIGSPNSSPFRYELLAVGMLTLELAVQSYKRRFFVYLIWP
jgi:hypothetical protein